MSIPPDGSRQLSGPPVVLSVFALSIAELGRQLEQQSIASQMDACMTDTTTTPEEPRRWDPNTRPSSPSSASLPSYSHMPPSPAHSKTSIPARDATDPTNLHDILDALLYPSPTQKTSAESISSTDGRCPVELRSAGDRQWARLIPARSNGPSPCWRMWVCRDQIRAPCVPVIRPPSSQPYVSKRTRMRRLRRKRD